MSTGPRRDGKTLGWSILRGGFLGFGLFGVGLLLALELAFSRRGVHPGWWLLYPVIYVAGALTYGGLRWLFSGRSWRHGSTERPRTRWLRRSVSGLASLPVVFLVLLFAGGGLCHWDGGYAAARYEFTVVDGDGNPVTGAEFRVLGPTRETWERDWRQPDTSDGLPPRLAGFWPVFEFGGDPLKTDPDGRLVVHQVDHGIQFSGNCYTMFGTDFDTSTTRPSHALEFRHPSFRKVVLDFDTLDRRAWRANRSEVKGPAGRPVPSIEVQVVMEPE